MNRADRINATHAIIIGDDELARGSATVKTLDSGEQETVDFDSLADYLGGEYAERLADLLSGLDE